MRLFPFCIQSLAVIAKRQSSSSRSPVMRLNVISFGASIVVVMNICSRKLGVKWLDFHYSPPLGSLILLDTIG